MAVSKIAVIAIVAIVAAPILLGYAFNLSEETVTDYKPDGDSVNVTPLLQTGTAYNNANAEINKLNTEFKYNSFDYRPVYSSISNTATSFKQNQSSVTIQPNGVVYWRIGSFVNINVFVGADHNVTFERRDPSGNNVLTSHQYFSGLTYSSSDNVVYVSWAYGSGGGEFNYTVADPLEFIYFRNDGATAVKLYTSYDSSSESRYVDLAGGYYFPSMKKAVVTYIPEKTKSVLLTVDLNSITASDYTFNIAVGPVMNIRLIKTTVDGNVTWSALNATASPNEYIAESLYYNPAGSNTYQIYINTDNINTYDNPNNPGQTIYVNKTQVEFRYVGAWPTLIGNANYYQKYSYDYTGESVYNNTFDYISYATIPAADTARSPLLRIDAAVYRAFAYGIISEATYSPGDFKTNPTTTLDVSVSGVSLEFGGNTYTVDSSGNITMGTHKVSTNGMKLSSIPVAGGYENRINDYVVSTTAQPSTIKFNGNWGASVSTVANATTTYTKTEWHVGEFGWDGMDQNFLIVGLITCLGVFVGLGIYARKSRSGGIIPLMIITGCAAAVFFIML
jgi:hypothetical protein